MKSYIQLIDTKTTGRRYDVSPIYSSPKAFRDLIQDLKESTNGVAFDLVGGIDAYGFILGAAFAYSCNRGLVLFRKGGKLPVRCESVEFIDYSGSQKSLEIRSDQISPECRVLIVDDWIETGAQVAAAIQLVERVGGIVSGIAAINIDSNEMTAAVLSRYPQFSLTHLYGDGWAG